MVNILSPTYFCGCLPPFYFRTTAPPDAPGCVGHNTLHPMEQHTLVLIHTHDLLRSGLARTLAATGAYRILADVADPTAFKRAIALGKQPELAVLCLENATSMLAWLKIHLPMCANMVLGGDEPPEQIIPLFKAGADGYHSTRDGQEVLCCGLECLGHGAKFFAAPVWERIQALMPLAQAKPTIIRYPTPAEAEFLVHLAAPDHPTYAEIALRMNKSERTIEKYRYDLCKANGIKTKAGLVDFARACGLV